MPSPRPAVPAQPPPSDPIPTFRRSLLLDRRQEQTWWLRLPGRLSTGALWLAALCLIGPIKLTPLLLTGSVLGPALLLLDRQQRRNPPLRIMRPAVTALPPRGLPRATVAEGIGLAESQLFRARHTTICTIHHDAEGEILAIAMQDSSSLVSLPRRHAHPVS